MINRYFPLVRRSKSRKSGKGEETRNKAFSLHSVTSKTLLVSKDQVSSIYLENSQPNGLDQTFGKESFLENGQKQSKYAVKKIPRNKISTESFNQRMNRENMTQGVSSDVSITRVKSLMYPDIEMKTLNTNENELLETQHNTKEKYESRGRDRQIIVAHPHVKSEIMARDPVVKNVAVSFVRGRSLSKSKKSGNATSTNQLDVRHETHTKNMPSGAPNLDQKARRRSRDSKSRKINVSLFK